MAFSSLLAAAVPAQVRVVGEKYFERERVEIFESGRDAVEALVQAHVEYQVYIERQGDGIFAECSCPYVRKRGEPCAHIWATILAAEEQRALGSDRDNRRLALDASPDLDEEPGEDGAWFEEESDDFDEPAPWPPSAWGRPARPLSAAPRSSSQIPIANPDWKNQLHVLQHEAAYANRAPAAWPENREIVYILNSPSAIPADSLSITVGYRARKKDGDWGNVQYQNIGSREIAGMSDQADRDILGLFAGIQRSTALYGYAGGSFSFHLSEPILSELLPRLCRTGRSCLQGALGVNDYKPLTWDDGPAWEFRVDVALENSGKRYLVRGQLQRGDERRALTDARMLLRRFVIWDDCVARLHEQSADGWMRILRHQMLAVPKKQADSFVVELAKVPQLPTVNLPDALRFEQVQGTPRPILKIKAPAQSYYGPRNLIAELSFDYEGKSLVHRSADAGVFQKDKRRFIRRDAVAESQAAQKLQELGFRQGYSAGFELAPKKLPAVVRPLIEAGWQVEAQGKLYRRPGEIKIEVSSGIDWFELHGSVAFDDKVAQLPELLAALRRGDNAVLLGDGTFGILPEEWLKKHGVLAGLGTVKENHLEFKRSQVGLLDALLGAQPEANFDATFARARDELGTFSAVVPSDPPASFAGQLRGYQRDGLGWLHFLQRFGFGGCLADDMGLGKTIQVLALLEERRRLRNGKKDGAAPSLVVVPRSLIFNWKQEAAHFTPALRVLDYSGAARERSTAHFEHFDLILTTYGTLRKDIPHLKDFGFDYCILDESQAVKNPSTESAKAVRLLQANQRLALSGTPIENHLGELWSLFEFLNPGMLGAVSLFRLLGVNVRNPNPETRQLLARALKPFILRRTKAQVAKDLPAKLEQTIFCELEPPQRRLYNELRDHFRSTLRKRIEREGINKAKIHVLEALLRLRQAACHPALIDQQRTGDASAKLDTLLPQLDEVADAGHKALVFSQFTSFLAIVRARLDKHKVVYEYLDGQTRDRGARVKRFQEDRQCKLFLISLKAGGLGLNLTAAEYVFLLDPWWNPAVEAQAIDRSHRIGQTREVFAYRLIARDTVEEKVLELQQSKRALADAIINADNRLIGDLTREDLELLLS